MCNCRVFSNPLIAIPQRRLTAVAALVMGLALALPAQAQSAPPVYRYQDGRVNAEAEVNPLAGRLLGTALKKEIPASFSFAATDLAGSFTIPEKTVTRRGDGSISLDSTPVKAFLAPYLQQALAKVAQTHSLPEGIGIETLEQVVNYRLIGQGNLQAATQSTAFTFEYDDGTDLLVVKGMDSAVLSRCKVEQCNTQVEGDFDLNLDVEGFSKTSSELDIDLPDGVRRALSQAKLFGLKEVAFAEGKLSSNVQVLPQQEPVPAPAPASEGATSQSSLNQRSLRGSVWPQASAFKPVSFTAGQVQADSESWMEAPSQANSIQPLYQLTQGNFVLTAQRMTAPWSFLFSVPSH